MDAQIRLAYFYCDYSQSNSLETIAILGSLVKQLLYWVQIPQDIASEIDRSYRYRPNTRKPTANELKSILLSAIKLYTGHRVCFVIDGIDECRIEERSKLLKLLKELAESNDIMVKIFVASRDEIDIMQQLEQYPSIRISEANTMDDISLFIRESIESKAMTQDIVVRDPKLLDDITNALLDGACGMYAFKWFFKRTLILWISGFCGLHSSFTISVKPIQTIVSEKSFANFRRVWLRHIYGFYKR